GQMRRPDALPVILECLGDKDPIVTGAAQTALANYMHPLPSSDDYGAMLEIMFGQQKLLNGPVLERVLDFFRREAPKNQPYSGIFERWAGMLIEDGALLHQLKGAMLPAAPQKVPAPAIASPGAAPAATATPPGGSSDSGAGTRGALPMSELDMKR